MSKNNFLQKIDKKIIEESKNIATYKNDHSSINGKKPIAVISPRNYEDCLKIIKEANTEKQSIVVRGAGTGTTGGALANTESIIVNLDKMNQIIEFDEKNAMMVVEPGVILNEISQLAEKKGLFYPPDPASIQRCTIGGNVAENAGGPRALKYGVTRDYIIGLKGIWANGNPFNLGGKQIKNVSGYDLIGLLTGSEGTLGLITEITLKLIPKPKYISEAMCGFKDKHSAANALIKVRQSGIQPSVAEYMLDICVKASHTYLEIDSKLKDSKAYIIWQVDGANKNSTLDQMETIKKICNENNSNQWIDMNNKKTSNYIWGVRRSVSLGLRKIAGSKCSEDVVVPPAKVPEFLIELENMNHKSGIKVLGYGHLGDGNIHVNILKMKASDAAWNEEKDLVVKKVMELAVKFGGTISGEHGIGYTKKEYLPLVFTEHDISLMKSIKKIVDPNNIMNPGKIFD